MFTIKVDGLKELQQRLAQFGPKVQNNGQRAATFAGAKVFRDAIRQSITASDEPSSPGEPPKSKTGQLEAGIAAFKRQGPPGKVAYSVGVKGKRQKYANTALNRRKRRVGKTFQQDTRNSHVARLLEFGTAKMAARPFVRPQFEKNVDAAIEAIRDRLAKAIEDAASR